MLRYILLSCTLLAGITFSAFSIAAAEPTLQEVYQAAEAGRMSEAQGMMDKVLRDHPNSAKAHFVEAELLAKQDRLANAATELSTAERLAPGLPFAKPQAVENLKARIYSSRASTQSVPGAHVAQSAPAMSEIPWGLLLGGLGLIAAIVFFVRSMRQRNAAVVSSAARPGFGTGFGSGAASQPQGAGGVAPPVGPTAGGIGSGILGGLATGAALGAGMVAGEALAHHFTEGSRHQIDQSPIPAVNDTAQYDMGGNDFGISDGSAWDDNSGGSDWT